MLLSVLFCNSWVSANFFFAYHTLIILFKNLYPHMFSLIIKFSLPQIMILNNGYLKVANYSDAIDNF